MPRQRLFLLLIPVLFLAGILIYKFVPENNVKASASDNVSGWAWSENIGWISFNSTNQEGGTSYGVKVEGNGNLSGFAWSENIGWISFNENSGCPSNPCKAKFAKSSGEVSGWARACAGTINGDCTGASRSDGWDGWIRLRGTNYGVSVAGCQWNGYAWGSDVMGWINFRGSNYGVNGSGDACQNTQCNDGIDNDGDGLTDHPNDAGCSNPGDNDERNLCSDGLDNDGDGDIDYPEDSGCANAQDNNETNVAACADGEDNDSDGKIDFPEDPGCSSVSDNSEEDLSLPLFQEINP